jgi:hypothetical protein
LLAGSAFPLEEASKHLPAVLGEFKAASSAVAFEETSEEKIRIFAPISAATRSYRSKNGDVLFVALVVTRSDSTAYSLLTNSGCPGGIGAPDATLAGLEAQSCVFPASVQFAKGPVYAQVMMKKGAPLASVALKNLAQVLSESLDKGEGDIPALVKHLPDWQSVHHQISYSTNLENLKSTLNNQAVLEAVSFEGGAEAVVARYDAGTLAIVEFNTPQIATTNDHNIVARINELKASVPPAGPPLAPAYRRVGNYAVFVFDAPTQEAANQLIDRVKYQQVVQWLGENPFSLEEATREFTETTLGVFVSVVKASGLALVSCLAIGGLFGTLLFRVRRAQQRSREAYADSDAMLRLNLDELTPESDPGRLLQRRN